MENELQPTNKGGDLVKIDKAAFIKRFEPVNMVTEFKHVKNVPQAIAEDPNAISYYSKHLGPDAILALIELHLVALNESVNVGKPLTKFQIKEIAVEITAVYYFLSMVEIQFVFRKAKRGEFGQLYGALNIVAILDWFAQYSEERVQYHINENIKHRTNDHSLRSEERKLWERHEKLINKNQANDNK